MSKALFGRDKWTSIAGYILAGLLALDEITKAGETSYTRILLAVALAVMGRVVNTCNQHKPNPKINRKSSEQFLFRKTNSSLPENDRKHGDCDKSATGTPGG